MNERPIRPIRPGGQISAREFNRAMEKIDETGDFGGPGFSDEFGQILQNPPAKQVRTNVRILSGSNPYAWEEVNQLPDNTWIATGLLSGDINSNPLFERNGDTAIAADNIYEAVFVGMIDGTGRWLFNGGGTAAASNPQFFPAILDCRVSDGGIWLYAWRELEWTTATAIATVKASGWQGFPPQSATVVKTGVGDLAALGDGHTDVAESQLVTFCGQPKTDGTWSLGCATGLVADQDAAGVQSALRDCLSIDVVVTGDMDNGFAISWPDPGPQDTLIADMTGIIPSGPSWPAGELNNFKTGILPLNVWMTRAFMTDPVTVSVTKTATGDDEETFDAWSIYIENATGGTLAVSIDGTSTGSLNYGIASDDLKTTIEDQLEISDISGDGTSSTPWTFSATADTAPHSLTVDISKLRNGDGFRFERPWPDCPGDVIPGYDPDATLNIVTLDSDCWFAVQPEDCEDVTPDAVGLALAADLTASGTLIELTAGENLVFGEVCYMKSDGKFWKADANSAGKYPVEAMATATIAANVSGVFLLDGLARKDAWTWTIGGALYLSKTAGAIVQDVSTYTTTGDVTQAIGRAFSATVMRFKPSENYTVAP